MKARLPIIVLLMAISAGGTQARAAASDETQAPELGRSGTPRALPPTLVDEDVIAATTCQVPVRPRRLFVHEAARTMDARLDPMSLRPVRCM